MTRLSMALTALDRLEDAKANRRPVGEIVRFEAAYRDARNNATDQLDAYRRMVERLPVTTWLAGHTNREATSSAQTLTTQPDEPPR